MMLKSAFPVLPKRTAMLEGIVIKAVIITSGLAPLQERFFHHAGKTWIGNNVYLFYLEFAEFLIKPLQ